MLIFNDQQQIKRSAELNKELNKTMLGVAVF